MIYIHHVHIDVFIFENNDTRQRKNVILFVLIWTACFHKTTILSGLWTFLIAHIFPVDRKKLFIGIIGLSIHVECHSSQEQRTDLQIH